MSATAVAPKSTWKILIGLAIVCGAVAFAAGFLHQRAVTKAVDTQQARSAAFARSALPTAVSGANLSKQAGEETAKELDRKIEPPAHTDVRLYALNGTLVYASPGAGMLAGSSEAITDAGKGKVSRVIDNDDLVVYAPIPSDKKGVLAVAAIVTDYAALRADATGPLDTFRMPLLGLAVVLLIAGLALMVRSAKGGARPVRAPKAAKAANAGEPKKSKGSITGFEPAARTGQAEDESVVENHPEVAAAAPEASKSKRFSIGRKHGDTDETDAASEGTSSKSRGRFSRKAAVEQGESPALADSPKDDMALQREIAIRQALEDQLEQLRTRLQMQEEQSVAAIRELQARLEANEVGSGLAPSPTASADPDVMERVRSMEAELAEARRVAAEAAAQASELRDRLDAAPASSIATDAAAIEAQVQEMQAQLEQAQRSAADSEQRAQSIESVRGELEVRVAQLGSKAGELEQKAEELEARLREANEGGDAVRAEIATLTAALAAAEARATELESGASAFADAQTEITRLRGELGKQMERAQEAEEQVATLQADVAAATQGLQLDVATDAREPGGAPDIESDSTPEPSTSEPEPEKAFTSEPEPENAFTSEPEAIQAATAEPASEPELVQSVTFEREPGPVQSVTFEPGARARARAATIPLSRSRSPRRRSPLSRSRSPRRRSPLSRSRSPRRRSPLSRSRSPRRRSPLSRSRRQRSSRCSLASSLQLLTRSRPRRPSCKSRQRTTSTRVLPRPMRASKPTTIRRTMRPNLTSWPSSHERGRRSPRSSRTSRSPRLRVARIATTTCGPPPSLKPAVRTGRPASNSRSSPSRPPLPPRRRIPIAQRSPPTRSPSTMIYGRSVLASPMRATQSHNVRTHPLRPGSRRTRSKSARWRDDSGDRSLCRGGDHRPRLPLDHARERHRRLSRNRRSWARLSRIRVAHPAADPRVDAGIVVARRMSGIAR